MLWKIHNLPKIEIDSRVFNQWQVWETLLGNKSNHTGGKEIQEKESKNKSPKVNIIEHHNNYLIGTDILNIKFLDFACLEGEFTQMFGI